MSRRKSTVRRRVGRKHEVGGIVAERFGKHILRGALAVFMASDTAAVLFVLGPDPGARAERHAIAVHRLQLDGRVRRHQQMKRAVVIEIQFSQQTFRIIPDRLSAPAARASPSITRMRWAVPGGIHSRFRSLSYTLRQYSFDQF